MARLHDTWMSPTKLELLAGWLPRQPWYRSTGRSPQLRRAGGFRLDDPDGEVGIEVLFVTDGASTTYQVPLGYRGAPPAGAEAALVGTAEHGVLGPRWIYDGVRDPVVAAQLLALVRGEVVAQHQSVSDTPDPSVTSIAVEPAGGEASPEALTLHVLRVLAADDAVAGDDGEGQREIVGTIEAEVRPPDSAPVRRHIAVLERATSGDPGVRDDQ